MEVIKLRANNMENRLEEIIKIYLGKDADRLSDFELVDNLEFDDIEAELGEVMTCSFRLEGIYDSSCKEEDLKDLYCIGINRVHTQYNFEEDQLYYFYVVASVTNCSLFKDDIWTELGKISRRSNVIEKVLSSKEVRDLNALSGLEL